MPNTILLNRRIVRGSAPATGISGASLNIGAARRRGLRLHIQPGTNLAAFAQSLIPTGLSVGLSTSATAPIAASLLPAATHPVHAVEHAPTNQNNSHATNQAQALPVVLPIGSPHTPQQTAPVAAAVLAEHENSSTFSV